MSYTVYVIVNDYGALMLVLYTATTSCVYIVTNMSLSCTIPVLYTTILTHLHSYIYICTPLLFIYIYAQLTLANVEAGETPITYKIATKSVPEWLQITPMLGTIRSLSPALQHPSFLITPPSFSQISHFSTLLF